MKKPNTPPLCRQDVAEYLTNGVDFDPAERWLGLLPTAWGLIILLGSGLAFTILLIYLLKSLF